MVYEDKAKSGRYLAQSSHLQLEIFLVFIFQYFSLHDCCLEIILLFRRYLPIEIFNNLPKNFMPKEDVFVDTVQKSNLLLKDIEDELDWVDSNLYYRIVLPVLAGEKATVQRLLLFGS